TEFIRLRWSGLLLNPVLVAGGLWLLVAGPIIAARLATWRTRLALGHCPECGYDLRGDFAAGCPECGWNRTAPRPTGAFDRGSAHPRASRVPMPRCVRRIVRAVRLASLFLVAGLATTLVVAWSFGWFLRWNGPAIRSAYLTPRGHHSASIRSWQA